MKNPFAKAFKVPTDQPYRTREIKFINAIKINEWQIKVYSITQNNSKMDEEFYAATIRSLKSWLRKSKLSSFENYGVGTLILHQGQRDKLAVINWWIDVNMIQNYVYQFHPLTKKFTLFSKNGICSCVWELAVIWFERNLWVEEILKKIPNPNFEKFWSTNLNSSY